MTMASRLAFAHELKELVEKHRISIEDNYEGLVFSTIGDDEYVFPRVMENGEWEVELSLGWELNDSISNRVLRDKVEIISGEERPAGVLAFPRRSGSVYYLIDVDGNGSWFVRASAYEKSTLGEPHPQLVTKDFPIDDKLFFELLAEAEASRG